MSETSFKGCGEKIHPINEFHRIEYEILTSINSLKKLVETSEISASVYEAEIKKKFGYDEIEGWGCADEEIDTLYEYRNIQRNAIFLMAYSYYEGKFKEIAGLVEFKINDKLKIKDLSGTGAKKYWNYIFKVLKISHNDKLLKINEVLDKVYKLLNKVTHELNQIKENDILSFKKHGIIMNSDTFEISDIMFFDFLFNQIETFFDLLIIEIDAKLKSLKLEND